MRPHEKFGLETQAVRQAREKLLKITDEFIPEDKTLPTLAKLFVEGSLVPADPDPETGEPAKTPKPPAPYLAIAPCPSCLTTFVPVPGANMPVAAFEFLDRLRKGGDVVNLVRHYLCDCEDAMHRRDECPKHLPQVEIPEEAVSRYVSEEVRRVIEAGDGFRCRVPGCLNQLPLEGRHIHPFCENGPPTAKNLATQCATCNALIEEQKLRVVGVAPFEKYYRADGTFLGWGFDPTPFPRPARDEVTPSNQVDPPVSHVGQDGQADGAGDGAGRIAESRLLWGDLAAP